MKTPQERFANKAAQEIWDKAYHDRSCAPFRVTLNQKRHVNTLANTYYMFHGHISRPEYDFSTATHPQEWLCYAMAKEALTALLPKPGSKKVRTPRQIVDQTNRLADKFYTLQGHISRPAFNFRNARHPQEQLCWWMAVEAQRVFTDTDVDDVISELED